MALSIVSNQAASIATRQLGQSNDAATATAEKLSSGKRVNSAKDDAAASAIAARLTAEVAGLQQAGVNAGQASSLLQIADGAFQNVEDILTRAKSLSVQAGSDQISNSERAFLDQEFQALKEEIDRISSDTEFNGVKLVNGKVDQNAVNGGNGVTEENLDGNAIALDSAGNQAMVSEFVVQNGENITSVVTGIATTMGGSGSIAQGNFLQANAAIGASADFAGGFSMTDFEGVAGYQGVNFNVDLGNSMTISQTVNGNAVADNLRSAEFNVNVAATGDVATAVAMLTFSAMAGVMTSGGGTANKTFTFMTSISANPLASGTTMVTGASGALVATVQTDGEIAAMLAPTRDVTLKAVAASGSYDGSVTLMLTGAISGAAIMATTSAGNATNAAAGQDVLLNGKENKDFTFKVGTGVSETEDEIGVSIGGVGTAALNIESASLSTREGANSASVAISNAIDTLQEKRSEVGAAQNRLDFAAQNVELTRENQEAARSELEDLNVAKAITEFSQQQLLVQAGTSTLSQANSLPQNLLQLFR